MMVECPKCQFVQPDDEYCAQCGVNMRTYQPKKEFFLKKPSVQITILILIAGGTLHQLFSKHSSVFSNSQHSKGQIQVNQVHSDGSSEESFANEDNIASTHLSSTTQENLTATRAYEKNIPAPNTSVATNSSSPTITVYFAEVNRQILQSQIQDSAKEGLFLTFKDYSAGLIPLLDKNLLTNQQIRILHKEEKNGELNKPIELFYGINNSIGIQMSIHINNININADERKLEGNIQIRTRWQQETATSTSYPANFEISDRDVFFVAGILPAQLSRQISKESFDELKKHSIYKIYDSKSFTQGESSFVIYIDSEYK